VSFGSQNRRSSALFAPNVVPTTNDAQSGLWDLLRGHPGLQRLFATTR
jgi:hypothetical protein